MAARPWLGVGCVLASLGVHGAVGAWAARAAPQLGATRELAVGGMVEVARSRSSAAARREVAAAERATLVSIGRALRKKGSLPLGELVLRSNAIDGYEAGTGTDLDIALELYSMRVQRLRGALARLPLAEAVAEVFADVQYVGRPGGRMLDAVLTGRGSCEPVSQLVAAALHDAGLGDRAALRFWGAPRAGATHLAPVIDAPRELRSKSPPELVEWDLASGRPTQPGGVRFAASELVEVLARVGDQRLQKDQKDGAKGGGPAAGASAPGQATLPTLAGGFPPNGDPYAGGLPIFAQRAIRGASSQGGPSEEPTPPDFVLGCANQAPLVLLDPPRVQVDAERPFDVTLYRATGRPETVERLSDALFLVEHHFDGQHISVLEQAILAGCRVALYDRVSVELALSGDTEGALRASSSAQRARKDGEALVSALWNKPEPPRDAGALVAREWPLLFLAGGGDVLEVRLRKRGVKSWGEVLTLAALLLAPDTRERGAILAAKLAPRDQVDVMHELFFAHGSMRPWTSNVPLDAPAGCDAAALPYFAGYRVFRKVALRLWEGSVDRGAADLAVDETLTELLTDSRAAGLDVGMERALVRYFARHVLGIFQHREGSFVLVQRFDGWLRTHGYRDDELVEKPLASLLRAGRLDVQTYADAWRTMER